MNSADRMDELLTLAIRETVRQEWDAMASADVSEVVKTRGFRRMQKRMTSMIRSGSRKGKPHRIRRRKWLPAVIAACLLLLLLGAPVLAAVSGNTSLGNILRKMGEDFFNLPYDTPVDIDGVTVIRHSNVSTYTKIGDFLEQEGISVLWPTWLPDRLKVEEIIAFHDDGSIAYKFNNNMISFGIYKGSVDPSYRNDARTEIIRIGEIEVEGYFLSVDYLSVNYIEIIFEYGGYQYHITSTDEEEVMHILDGLVEMSP